MVQSIGAVACCPTVQEIQAEWSKFHRLAKWLAWSKLHWRDNVPDLEEAIAETIAHAWVHSQRLRTTKPEKPVKTAVRLAVRFGIDRVVRKVRFIPKPAPNYVDALDRRSRNELRCEEIVGGHELGIARCDVTDRYVVEAIIGKLPEHVQALARLLSYGASKASAFERRGLSRHKADRLVDNLRTALREIFDAISR